MYKRIAFSNFLFFENRIFIIAKLKYTEDIINQWKKDKEWIDNFYCFYQVAIVIP